MKSTSLIASVAILAAAFSVAAQAQTGRPSTVEVQAADDTPHVVAAAADADADVGSYARYLMLNGATREDAVAKARSVDHPSVQAGDRKAFAFWHRAPANAQAQPRQ